MVNLISKPEVFEDDHQGDGRRFYTDGRKVHRYLRELAAGVLLDNYPDAAPGAPLRPYEALVLER